MGKLEGKTQIFVLALVLDHFFSELYFFLKTYRVELQNLISFFNQREGSDHLFGDSVEEII